MKQKPRIMVFIGSYLPGNKSAGVITSLRNLVKELHGKYDFYIVTADRDKGETMPYSNVALNRWTKYEEANVFYSDDYTKSFASLRRIIESVDVDLYYFNSFYNRTDTVRVMLLWLLKLIRRKPFIVGPRGIFNMGEFKRLEGMKRVYRQVYKAFRLDRVTNWHATAEIEKAKILEYFPRAAKNIFVVGNLSGIVMKPITQRISKQPGCLRLMFISRISEKKNIRFIVDTLMKVKGKDIVCDIYGMIGSEEDREYWAQCEKAASNLPKNVRLIYKGEIPHEEVAEAFRNHHLFFFPTFGENYGHVIPESIANGCPILMSNTTPWNNISDYKAGWIYDLKDAEAFEKKLQDIVDMTFDEWEVYSKCAYQAAEKLLDTQALCKAHINMFDTVLDKAIKEDE